MKKVKVAKLQKLANSIARQKGYGSATEVLFGNCFQAEVIDRTDYGYRKKTTGQYVPKKYLMNFGWKNTYYQHAETVILLPFSIIDWEE